MEDIIIRRPKQCNILRRLKLVALPGALPTFGSMRILGLGIGRAQSGAAGAAARFSKEISTARYGVRSTYGVLLPRYIADRWLDQRNVCTLFPFTVRSTEHMPSTCI
jgi:hypothetical protein